MSRGWFGMLTCPRCRGEVTVAEDVHCGNCGGVGQRLDEELLSFDARRNEAAAIVAQWPEDFVRALQAWAEELEAGKAPSDAAWLEKLKRHGLAKADDTVTPLGHTVCYHLDEYRWQKGRKGLDGVLDFQAIGTTGRVLDVGCGAGQTLLSLEPDRPVEMFGVDVDAAALAFGLQLAKVEGIPLSLVGTPATALPFRDGLFDLVLTRVAINYMHQRTALGEMVRVLRPGGFLFCRVEGVWHDLRMLAKARGIKSFICRLRDLGWGTIHAMTGCQPPPGTTFKGGRAFASVGRLRRILADRGCNVTQVVECHTCPHLMGHRTQFIIVAQRGQ